MSEVWTGSKVEEAIHMQGDRDQGAMIAITNAIQYQLDLVIQLVLVQIGDLLVGLSLSQDQLFCETGKELDNMM